MPDQRELALEAELIAAYLRGDRRAGEAIERRCAPHVQRVVERFLADEPDLRAEAVQGTWRRLFGSLPHFLGGCLLRTYSKTLARNECLDLLRRRRRRRAREAELDAADALPDPESDTRRADRADPLWECLDTLPDPWRRVLLARADLPGKQCRELAEALGMEVEQVYETLYLARKAMRQCLEGKGFPRKTPRPERQGEGGCT